jgi:hypothetical protein
MLNCALIAQTSRLCYSRTCCGHGALMCVHLAGACKLVAGGALSPVRAPASLVLLLVGWFSGSPRRL